MLRGAGDLVSVAVDSRRKPVPVDAFPVAARRVVHDEPAGDHERVVACLARLARERPRPGRVALVVHTVVTLELGYVSIVGAVPTRCIADYFWA